MFWLLIVLLLIWILAVPVGPYPRRYSYGYYPFGALSAILIIFFLLWILGAFAVAL